MSELINKPGNELIGTERPSYLVNREPPKQLKEMGEHVKPLRLKIIQSLTGDPFKPPYTDGDIIIVPQMKQIGNLNSEFAFTPLYFYADYVKMNVLDMRGIEPFILDRSLDKNSALARKCEMFFDEPHPRVPSQMIRHRKILTFICLIHGYDDLSDIPIIIGFRSGQAGAKLITFIQTRKADSYACRFRAKSMLEKGKGSNKWFSLAIENDIQPWVEEHEFSKYEKMSQHYEDLVKRQLVIADYDDTDVDENIVEPAKETKF